MPLRLSVQWNKFLNRGNAVTNTLVSEAGQLYAAASGWVFRVDYHSAPVATNMLPGLGDHEVRLAAPADSSQLVIGTNGVARGLHPFTLAQLWQCDCPGAGSELVNPLCFGGRTYAATNGYVFRIDPANGRVLASSGLPGRGNHETRICGTFNGTKLIVGIDGYALLLDANTLRTVWERSLPGCGSAVTSVADGGGVIYAACNGHVYLLEQATGNVLHHNPLPDLGDHYVSLAVSRRTHLVYAGIHGWGVALDPATLGEVYRVCLPGSGFSDTEALAGDRVAYFANGGCLFQICDDGAHDVTPVDPSSLSPRLNQPTRISAALNNEGQFLLGVSGQVILAELNVQDVPWMGERRGILGPRKLRQVALPGSHNAGAYGFNSKSAFAADQLGSAPELVPIQTSPVPPAMISWTQAQPFDFGRQLAAGIRYFDLHVQPRNGDFVFVHGLVGARIWDLFFQLASFFTLHGMNDHEVIILHFSQFYAMGPKEHEQLASYIGSVPVKLVGNPFVPRSMGRDVTLDDIWRTDRRVLVFYDNDQMCDAHSFLWSAKDMSAPSPVSNTLGQDQLLPFLDARVREKHDGFFVLQAAVTPDPHLAALSIRPGSLMMPRQALTKDVMPGVTSWIDGLRAQRNSISAPNIFSCESVDLANFVSKVVQLNGA